MDEESDSFNRPPVNTKNSVHRQFYNTSETYLAILEQREEPGYRAILDALQTYVTEGRVLDYGCGVGLMSSLLGKRGFTVVGVDIAEQFIRSAKKKFGDSSSVSFELMDELPLRFSQGAFDAVVTSSVLEHCIGVDAILLEFHRLLKKTGYLVVETPNMLSPLTRLKLIAERLIGRRKNFHRYGSPGYFFESLFYLMKKLIVRKPEFIYRQPDYAAFSEADEDVTYLSNPIDLFYFLRAHGFEVLELSRNTGFFRKLISRYLPSVAGGVMIVARKQ